MKKIETEIKSIHDLFIGHEFIIPDFQRPYSWGKEDCSKLWEDVLSHIENSEAISEKEDYYLGSIVVYDEGEMDEDESNNIGWSIIDGQQRITTLLMLIKALFSFTRTVARLEQMMFKTHMNTGKAIKGKLRLKSKVAGDSERNDSNADFKTVMTGGYKTLNKKNLFRLNYECMEKLVNDWAEGFSADDLAKNIRNIIDRVVVLSIICKSSTDALNLFESVNNRGMNLTDADIFKAKIYKAAGEESNSFVGRWEGLGDNIDNLFRNYMQVSRAERKDISNEIALRKYMEKYHFDEKHKLDDKWDNIVCNLENTYKIYNQENICSGDKQSNEHWVYWRILYEYPNAYCQYPPIVFLHKYGERNDEEKFLLPDEKQDEYIALLKNTVRYFFIKGVAHNAANAVKKTTYKVCSAICHGEDYINEYKEVFAKDEKDLGDFWRKLQNSDYGKCKRGLVVLNSLLNIDQCPVDYKEVLSKKYDMEHILPRQWAHYDKWDKDSHNENFERIGNLMPLEKRCNIKASNEFFQRKQNEYKKSKVQDALDLSNEDPKTWYPEDVEKRHQKSMDRLRKFFKDFK